MKRLNRVFLVLFSILWLLSFVYRLFLDKGQFLTLLGEHHSSFWNSFFIVATQFAEEIVFITLALVFLFERFRISIAIAFTGISVTIVAGLLKKIFSFERPFVYFQNLGLEATYMKIEGIEPYTGLTSFPSGHTMAGFALMSLLSIYIRNTYLTILFFVVAVLVGLSRIYLGHHFMEDVLFGSIVGVVVSYIVFALLRKWKAAFLDRSFLKSKPENLGV